MFYCSYNSKTRAVEGKKHVVRDSEFHPDEKTMLLHLTPFSAWRDENARPEQKKWVHKRTVDIGTSFPVFVLDGDFEIWCEEEGRYLSPREVEAKGYFMNHAKIMEIESFPYASFRGWEEHEGEFEVYMPLGGGGWMRVRTKTTERKPSLIEIIWKYDGSYEEDRIACLAEVRAALAAGADVNEVDNPGFSPLHIALLQGLQAVVPLLLEAGADIEAKYDNSCTPLHMACILGKVESAQHLLKAGADIEARGEYGTTPLALAAMQGKAEIVQLLLEAGADIEARDEYGKSPLASAARKGKAEIVQILLKAGANIEARDENEHTPLIRAVDGPVLGRDSRESQEKTVQLLLEAGADVNVVDCEGRSLLELAGRRYRKESAMIKMLEEAIQKKNRHET